MSVVSGVLVTGSSVVRDAGHVDMALDKAGCDRQQEAANASTRWRLGTFWRSSAKAGLRVRFEAG